MQTQLSGNPLLFGRALDDKGRTNEALAEYREALRLRPDLDGPQIMVGLALAGEKKYDDAVAHYQAALKANPESAAAQSDWGLALLQQGRWQDSIAHYEQALRLDPALPEARSSLALAQFRYGLEWERLGQVREAASHYRSALRQNPDAPEPLQHLAWIAATDARPECRDGAQAVELATRACALTGQKSPSMLLTLAAAYAETGRFKDALATVQKAEQLAPAQKELEAEVARLRAAFAAGRPFHGQSE